MKRLSTKSDTKGKKKGGALKVKQVKPKVRRAIKKALDVAVPLATSIVAPELAPVAKALTDTFSEKVVNKMGDTFGFGTRGGALRAGSDYSQFQHIRSPAMNPVLPLPDFSRPNFTHTGAKTGGMMRGGSFLPPGY